MNGKPVGNRVEECISKLVIEFCSKIGKKSIVISIFQLQRSWLQSFKRPLCNALPKQIFRLVKYVLNNNKIYLMTDTSNIELYLNIFFDILVKI